MYDRLKLLIVKIIFFSFLFCDSAMVLDGLLFILYSGSVVMTDIYAMSRPLNMTLQALQLSCCLRLAEPQAQAQAQARGPAVQCPARRLVRCAVAARARRGRCRRAPGTGS